MTKSNFQSGFALIPLLVILILAGAAGWWVWEKLDKSENLTYRNDKYGFEIALPDSWRGYRVKGSSFPDGDSIFFVFTDTGGWDYEVALLGIYNEKSWNETIGGRGDLMIKRNGFYYAHIHPQAAPQSKDLLEKVNEGKKVLSGIKFDK